MMFAILEMRRAFVLPAEEGCPLVASLEICATALTRVLQTRKRCCRMCRATFAVIGAIENESRIDLCQVLRLRRSLAASVWVVAVSGRCYWS